MGDPDSQPDDRAPALGRNEGAELQRYKLTIAYDGASFHGWQKQVPPDGHKPIRTVQGVLEDALTRLLQQRITLTGSSRTDTGVHALGQVAHMEAATRIPIERLTKAINGRLPADIEVREAKPVDRTFHAIRGAVNKQYRYCVWNHDHRPLHRRKYVYHCWVDLDDAKMADAAARLVGTHDFEGFASAHHGRSTTVRTIFDCKVVREGDEVQFVVQGSGFLYNMVRIIAGTLIEVGRGRFEPGVVNEVLATQNRGLAGPTLPPEGLWLEWIEHQPVDPYSDEFARTDLPGSRQDEADPK